MFKSEIEGQCTDQLATIVLQVPTNPYFAMLTLTDSVATKILVHDGSAVIAIPVTQFSRHPNAAWRIEWKS